MGIFIRFTLLFTLVVGSFCCATCLCPTWAEPLGLDFWRLPELTTILHKEEQRAKKLAASRVIVAERARVKGKVLDRLIGGEICLKEAAEQLVLASDEWFLTRGLQTVPVKGETLKERVCYALVYWAHMKLRNTPARDREVQTRLKNQLPEAIITLRI